MVLPNDPFLIRTTAGDAKIIRGDTSKMKFGQDFQAALRREEFPREWVDSAISYKKLKKCIKRVRRELLSLGLDQETLNALWQHVSGRVTDETEQNLSDRLMQYSINGNQKLKFTPRLTIAIDPRDGSPMDAWLSPETRRYLKRLTPSSRAAVGTADDSPRTSPDATSRRPSNVAMEEVHNGPSDAVEPASPSKEDELETIEVPLTSDSEFFQILRQELRNLDQLQNKEQNQIEAEIIQLGHDLAELKQSRKKRSKEEVEAWRRIFELYNDAEIFLSSHEQDAGARDVNHAQRQLQYFTTCVIDQQKKQLRLSNEANNTLGRFIKINIDLLQLMKFQDMNQTALAKILKKFDKQTALHARAAIPDSFRRGPSTSQDLAKATSFTISKELLQLLPQLNDYLCPICFTVSYKPVRLACQHVFCIRCLIVMQREDQNSCPLCRAEVVLEANSDNVDIELKRFLEKNFKAEVREKQKANELAVAFDRFGEAYGKPAKCIVM